MRRLALAAVGLALLAPASPVAAAEPTGRYLVALERPASARSASAVSAVLSRAGARRAGRGEPRLGILTVRGGAGAIRTLRRDRRVASVSREYYRRLRRVPNDPALSTQETAFGGAGGAPVQWTLARENFPAAWDVTTGGQAVVGVIDSGIDAGHPELSGKIHSLDAVAGAQNPGSDEEGHGTHVSGLACASTDNGLGIAGAGWGCRVAMVKTPAPRIPDEAVVQGIRILVDRGAHAINMSFGGGPPNAALDLAIDHAFQHGVVLVAAASNDAEGDQGAPASQLQPGDGPNIGAGRGLVVTAADSEDTRPGTGFGPQISLAAYGFFDEQDGPPGVLASYPGHPTPRESAQIEFEDDVPELVPPCGCRRTFGGDDRYAYLQGTSMASPQVTALAGLVGAINPALRTDEKLRLIKQSARGNGSWGSDLGWGIIDAGRTLDAVRRVDRVAPASRARTRKRMRIRRARRRAAVRVRWRGSDPAGQPGLVPTGVRSYELFMRRGRGRYRRVRRPTSRRTAVLRLRPGVYRFYTRARDASGNREAAPRRADARLVIRRARR